MIRAKRKEGEKCVLPGVKVISIRVQTLKPNSWQPGKTGKLSYGVMATPQILVLLFPVRVRIAQQITVKHGNIKAAGIYRLLQLHIFNRENLPENRRAFGHCTAFH